MAYISMIIVKGLACLCKCITKHLRVIHNAWHFQFKVGFSVYGAMG